MTKAANDIEELLKIYRASVKAVSKFREKHDAVLDQLSQLEERVGSLAGQLRALALDGAKELKAGNHTVAEAGGMKLVVQRVRKIDGEALVALKPKVLSTAHHITISIPLAEAERLRAAKVITKEDFDTCTKLETRVSIKPTGEE